MEQETNKPQKALDIFTGMVIMHGTDGDKENWNSILDYINNIEADLYEVNCRIEDQLSIINDLEADLLSVYMKGIADSNELWRQTIQEIKEKNEKRTDEMRPYKHQAPFDFGVLNGIDECCRKLLEDK